MLWALALNRILSHDYSNTRKRYRQRFMPMSWWKWHLSHLGILSLLYLISDDIINNYWTRLSKISSFFTGEPINYLPKPKALTNHDILRCPSSIIVLSFDHQVCFHILITSWKLRVCHFSFENVVPTTHEQNVICSKTRLDGTTHEQTIIFRQLFAGHVVGSRPM